MKKRIFAILISILLILLIALPCHGAHSEGSISISLYEEDQKPISGMTVSLCKIASIEDNAFIWEGAFKDAGISMDALLSALNAQSAKTLLDYIDERAVPIMTVTASNGGARFEKLGLGLYLIFCKEGQSHYFIPHFLTLPYAQGNALSYHATTIPKLRENTGLDKSIYAIKKWEDQGNAKGARPSSIEIMLKRNGATIQKATLSAKNGWAFTFKGLPEDGKYTIEEKTVKNYTPHYSGDAENGFIITNTLRTEKLPQTGQLWWPFILLLTASLCFIFLGIMELHGKKNEKKSK